MMDCLSEFTYSMYVDGELAEPERLRVQQHLAQCPQCRRLAAALEAENRMLSEVFNLVDEPGAARQRVGRSLLFTVASALAVAVALDQAAAGVARVAPGAVSWMNSFSVSWFQTYFLNNAFELIREGPAMLNALVTVLGVAVLGGIAVAVLRYVLSRHPISMALFAAVGLALVVPGSASAIENRHATEMRVGADQTVDETLVATGGTAYIEGTINGNLIFAGEHLVVRGTVKGNVFAFGHEVEIAGTVEGGVYLSAGTAILSGHVERDVYFWAGAVQIDSTARLDGDLLGGGGDTRLSGVVGRDVDLATGSLEVRGSVGRNLRVSTNLLTVDSEAHVGGNLHVRVENAQRVQIEPGATIAGKTETEIKKSASHFRDSKYYFWQAIWLAGALLLGLLLHWIVPGVFAARMDSGGALLRSAGVGFLVLVATPVAAVVACITLVGIPAGVITFALWLTCLYFAKVFVGAALGRGFLPAQPGSAAGFALPLLAGLVVVFVAVNLPYVGGWLGFVVLLVGLGLEFLGARASLRRGAVTP